MKTHDVERLDEKDEEIAEALISLGISRYVARTLACLQNMDEATAAEFGAALMPSQPEVSIAMKELKERGWISEHEEKKTGKGRPYKVYSLKAGLKGIIAHLKKQQKKGIEETQSKIKRLKELGKQ